MAMTTAKMREKARLYESKLDWLNAADCWEDALNLYPNTPGELADRDRAAMAHKAADCRRAYRVSRGELKY